jgi:hypothetical protein
MEGDEGALTAQVQHAARSPGTPCPSLTCEVGKLVDAPDGGPVGGEGQNDLRRVMEMAANSSGVFFHAQQSLSCPARAPCLDAAAASLRQEVVQPPQHALIEVARAQQGGVGVADAVGPAAGRGAGEG